MKKQTVKRININLTGYEVEALKRLQEKFPEESTSDIIRDAIENYSEEKIGFCRFGF